MKKTLSLEEIWAAVFVIWAFVEVIQGWDQCGGDYAVCPGQEANIWVSIADWHSWDGDEEDEGDEDRITVWRSAHAPGDPDGFLREQALTSR
jgi:hypothetical protein